MKTVFITGYQHSGTSIVRRLLGAHPDTHEIVWEMPPSGIPPEEIETARMTAKSHLVCKLAVVNLELCTPEVGGDSRIGLIRNPLDALASQYLRSKDFSMEAALEQVQIWDEWARWWVEHRSSDDPAQCCIRYEDLFDGGATLGAIQTTAGLTARDDLVKRIRRHRVPINHKRVPWRKPRRTEHEAFRSWQIHQKFRNRNGENRSALPEDVAVQLTELASFQKIYG